MAETRDEAIIEDAYYIRDLVNHSTQTKELTNAFFDLSATEQAITHKEMGDGDKRIPIRDTKGEIVDYELIPFSAEDYHRRSGRIDGLAWLENEIQFLIQKANDEDQRKEEKK